MSHVPQHLNQLLAVNLIVIMLDMPLLVLQLVNLHDLQVSLKPAIYSFKLKLEFAVLSQLMCLVSGLGNDRSRKSSTVVPFVTEKSDRSGASNSISDFLDVVKIAGDLRRPNGTTTIHVSDILGPPLEQSRNSTFSASFLPLDLFQHPFSLFHRFTFRSLQCGSRKIPRLQLTWSTKGSACGASNKRFQTTSCSRIFLLAPCKFDLVPGRERRSHISA